MYRENSNQRKFSFKEKEFELGKRTYIMGILNITPDSFSDGGKYNTIEQAVNRARDMINNGVDILDVGGESTRPGYISVDANEELMRVIPVVKALSKEFDTPISVDTSKALVAKTALDAGASIINDIWGLLRDPDIANIVSFENAGVILMHNKEDDTYGDIINEVIRHLKKCIDIAKNSGINYNNIIIDPGIGFGKSHNQNLQIMNRLHELKVLDKPIMIGTSRKSLIGKTLGLPVQERLEGTISTVTLGIQKGADIVRVHDVKEIKRAVDMTDAIVRM